MPPTPAADRCACQPTYRGTIRGADGTSHAVDDTHGVCESMRARL